MLDQSSPRLRSFCFIHSFTDPSVKRTGYGDVDDDFRNDGSGFLCLYASKWNQFTDPNNTTVFVGGLSGYVIEDELRSFFQGFGGITYGQIRPGTDESVEWMIRSVEGNPPWCCGRYSKSPLPTFLSGSSC